MTLELLRDSYEEMKANITPEYNKKVSKMIEIFSDGKYKNVCLLCSEPTTEKCHRRLVSEKLLERFSNDIVFGGNL